MSRWQLGDFSQAATRLSCTSTRRQFQPNQHDHTPHTYPSLDGSRIPLASGPHASLAVPLHDTHSTEPESSSLIGRQPTTQASMIMAASLAQFGQVTQPCRLGDSYSARHRDFVLPPPPNPASSSHIHIMYTLIHPPQHRMPHPPLYPRCPALEELSGALLQTLPRHTHMPDYRGQPRQSASAVM